MKMNKKVKIFGKQIPAVLLALVAIAGLASAGLLSYYGMITGTAKVEQSVVLDDTPCITPDACVIKPTYSVVGGDTYIDGPHSLINDANVPATVKFETNYTPSPEEGKEYGITTTYWKLVGYTATKTTPDGTGTIPATITVEDLGDSIKWTIDMNETSGFFKNGHAAVALIIGVGDKILYQVHSNDGTCAAFPWGTWLYSEYDPTGGGWNGWHTSEAAWNKQVDGTPDPMPEINATGERDLTANQQLIYTITISKSKLHPGEFKWAMALMGDTSNTYTPGTFSWSDNSTTNFHTAKVGIEIPKDTSFTLLPAQELKFLIANTFAINLVPDTYTITTGIVPVPS
jgi:hypothetical protein